MWYRSNTQRVLCPVIFIATRSANLAAFGARRGAPTGDGTSHLILYPDLHTIVVCLAPGVHWTLVFTAASLEHLAERNIEAADVADAVYGRHGPARVRRTGRGVRQRWFVMAPVDTGDLLTCVLRVASPRDLSAEGAFVISSEGLPEAPGRFNPSMRLCVSARVAMKDEVRSYRRWRASKGDR